jgi:integrase
MGKRRRFQLSTLPRFRPVSGAILLHHYAQAPHGIPHMAHITKHNGRWRAQVARSGVRVSKVFDTKAEATGWAAKEEASILAAERGQFPARTLREALEKYADEVSPKKKGQGWEQRKLIAFEAQLGKALLDKVLSKITTADLAQWRDARLKTVTDGTVQRDINLLRNVFTVARKEWKWTGPNPFSDMTHPGDNPPRIRRVDWREVKRICRNLGYRTGKVQTKQQEVALAFLLGLRTGMRAGEILSLCDERVDLAIRTARVPHKTQHLTGQMREVPLTRAGVRLLRCVAGRGRFFTITSASLDSLFRKARDRLLIKDLHFHDSRAEALTRLSRKVDVMTLARISGHKDLRTLLDTYYRESAADIAKRL